MPLIRRTVPPPVSRAIVVDPPYVAQRCFVEAVPRLPSLEKVGAEPVARAHAALVVPTFVHDNGGKHLLDRILFVNLERVYHRLGKNWRARVFKVREQSPPVRHGRLLPVIIVSRIK